jgi:hypothetical protein
MNASNRLLWHTIDAATRKGSRNRSSGHWLSTFAMLAITLIACGVLLWADQHFV